MSRLAPLLADADPAVAAVAASALGRIGGESAIRALLGSLNTANVVARRRGAAGSGLRDQARELLRALPAGKD